LEGEEADLGQHCGIFLKMHICPEQTCCVFIGIWDPAQAAWGQLVFSICAAKLNGVFN